MAIYATKLGANILTTSHMRFVRTWVPFGRGPIWSWILFRNRYVCAVQKVATLRVMTPPMHARTDEWRTPTSSSGAQWKTTSFQGPKTIHRPFGHSSNGVAHLPGRPGTHQWNCYKPASLFPQLYANQNSNELPRVVSH